MADPKDALQETPAQIPRVNTYCENGWLDLSGGPRDALKAGNVEPPPHAPTPAARFDRERVELAKGTRKGLHKSKACQASSHIC